MPKDKFEKKWFKKKTESTWVDSTNQKLEIWGRDNLIKISWKNHEAQVPITQCQMMKLIKKLVLKKDKKKTELKPD
jgi:hypothetical protein